MTERFALRIHAPSEVEAAEQGKAWADAEPAWSYLRVVSVDPHPEHWQVWTVTVECAPVEASR
jgi:hypothetical protein